MRKGKKFLAFVLAAAMMTITAACGSSEPSTNTPTDSTTGQEQSTEAADGISKGGVMTIVSKADFIYAGCPQASTQSHDWIMSAPAIESLGRRDEKGAIKPWLAESYDLDEEAMTISIKLREGITYHDGSPFNAESVVANYNLYQEYANANEADLDYAEATGEYEVLLHLKSLNGSTETMLLCDGGRMISVDYYNANKGLDGTSFMAIGTGPFKMLSADDTSISYKANEDYWVEGQPHLDGIEWILCADESTAMTILKSGEADAIYTPTTEDARNLLDQGGFENIGSGSAYYSSGFEISFNSGDKESPMSNVLVRQAFCTAIDTETIVNALGFGFYTPTNQLALPGSNFYSDNVTGYTYNQDAAHQLLVEAGYADGCEITLDYISATEKIVVMMQAYLEKAGFVVNLNLMERAIWTQAMMTSGDTSYNDAIVAYIPFAPAPMAKTFGDAADQFSGQWDKEIFAELNGYFNTMQNSLDSAEISEASDSFQKLLIDEQCMVMPVYGYYSQVIASESLHDLGFFETHTMFWTPEAAWKN